MLWIHDQQNFNWFLLLLQFSLKEAYGLPLKIVTVTIVPTVSLFSA